MPSYKYLVVIAMLSLGLSWPWQEQAAQDGSNEYQKPKTDIAAMNAAPIEENLSTALQVGEATTQMSSLEFDVATKIPEVARKIVNSDAEEKLNSPGISSSLNIDRAAENNLQASYAVEVSEKIQDLNMPQLNAIMDVSKNQVQIDRAMAAVEKIQQAELDHLNELSRVMNLAQKHRVIMEELRKAEEKGNDVTVVDREDILKQEELRAMREKQSS